MGGREGGVAGEWEGAGEGGEEYGRGKEAKLKPRWYQDISLGWTTGW